MSKKEGMTEGEDGGKRERRKGRESTSGGERKQASADWHVSMGAQERFGVRESCIIAAGQWEGSVKMFKGSVLATAE